MANGGKVVWENRESWRRTSDQGFVQLDRLSCRAQKYLLYGSMGGKSINRVLTCNLFNAIRIAESLISRSAPDAEGWVYKLQRVGSIPDANHLPQTHYFAVIDTNKLNWFLLGDTGAIAKGNFVSIADAVSEAESALIKAHKNEVDRNA